MKQAVLIVAIILCSIISGGIGATAVLKLWGGETPPETPPVTTTQTMQTPSQEPESIRNIESTIIQTADQISPSVVSIVIKKDLVIYRSDPFGFFQQPVGSVKRQVGGGTGFFVRDDGTIMTNKHVISDPNAVYTVITNDGTEYDAKLIATDPLSDIAIIQIQSDIETPALNVIESIDEVQVGQFAIAIGNALAEFQNSVSLGIVSGKERSIEAEGQKLSGLIQTDAAINPGNSGGPLVDLDGKVIGINTAIVYDTEGIGFSIGLTKKRIDYILESIATSGSIKRPFIGINYVGNSPGIQQELGLPVDYGAYIIDEPGSVIEGSSADASGIEPGDIILSVNGQDITLQNDLGAVIQNKIPGETLQITILKKSGQQENIELRLGEL